MSSLAALRREAGINALLSPPLSNPKVAKNGKKGIQTSVLHLAAGNMSGHEVCPKRSPGCSAACLMFAGNPLYFKAKNQARIKKTNLFFDNRNLFMNILALEIHTAAKKADTEKMEASFRLNGTSDLAWELKTFILLPWVAEKIGRGQGNIKTSIITLFSDLQFYDYTKIPKRTPPKNYHLTFSESEINMKEVVSEMLRGLNIASVFPKKAVPTEHLGRKVIDGDETDLRYLDEKGVVVGLKVKGSLGLADKTGFAHA